MKKIGLLITLTFFSLASAGQETQPVSRRPVKNEMAISFNFVGIFNAAINSPVDSISGDQIFDARYFVSDNMALRAGFGLGILNIEANTTNDTSGGQPLVESELINKNHSYTVSLGIEHHVKTASTTIDPFVGFSLYYTSISGEKQAETDKTIQRNGDFVNVRMETRNPGGYMLGVQVNAGFFWFFAPHIALGGEFSFGTGGGKIGGEKSVYTVTTTNTGGTLATSETSSRSELSESRKLMQTLNRGAINLLIRF